MKLLVPILYILFCTSLIAQQPCANNGSCQTAEEIIFPASMNQVCVIGCNNDMPHGPKLNGAGACNFMANPTAWYVFNTGDNNRASFNISSTDLTNPKFALFSSCDQWLECNPSISILESNTDYYIAVTDDDGLEGDFELCMNLYHASDSCLKSHKLEIIGSSMGSPLEGPFKPCEEITYRYTVNFDKTGSNWIHSIIPVISDCFDYIQNTEPLNTILPEGNAKWSWVDADSLHWKPSANEESLIGVDANSGKLCLLGAPGCIPFAGGTACSSEGTSLPGGWVGAVYSDGCKSISPNQAWGDSRVGNHFVTFTLKIPCDACENTTCNDFSVSIANFGDGQTGGYSSNKCNGSVMASKKILVKCCQQPSLDSVDAVICSKAAFDPTLDLQPSNSTIEWTVTAPDGLMGAFAGEGSGINQRLQNTSDEEQTAVYHIIPISPSGCKGDTTSIKVIVKPDILSNISHDLVNCKDSLLYIEADAQGGSGDGYSYSWSTGSDNESITILTDEAKTMTLTITDDEGCSQTDTLKITTITDPVSLPSSVKLTGSPTVFIDNFNKFSCEAFPVAQFYEWSIDGIVVGYGRVTEFRIPYLSLGTHTLCVRASNSCDLVGQSLCWDIKFIESPLNMDCTGAEYVCNKNKKSLTFPGSYGLAQELNTGDYCSGTTYGETNSHWINFDIAQAGKLWFTIKPKNPLDVDFVVFKRVDDGGCYTKKSVRCCYSSSGACNLDLGLSPDETDVFEGGGCENGNNGLLAALDCEVGDSYYLVILAYNSTEKTKYSIEFCGTALMTCDDYVCETLGSTSLISSNSLKVFPNPNDGNFTLELPHIMSGTLEIMDTNGKIIKNQRLIDYEKNQNISIKGLSPGLYNIMIRDTYGKTVGNCRLTTL